jgi:2-C-methyl-D-erythritol 2,4-cyclodiphosphate synthase
MRVGIGYDAHSLAEGRPLVLGGVSIHSDKGLQGWSDADVLVHAVIDALLGAASLGDIGTYFPPNNPAYEGISSILLLSHTSDMLNRQGWRVGNIDATIVAERPLLHPFVDQMRQNVSEALSVSRSQVGIKATTTERLGFCGRGEGIAAYAVALLTEHDQDL